VRRGGNRLSQGQHRFLNKEDWIRLGRAAGALSQTRIFIDDAAGASILEMRSKSRRLKAEHGLDLLIVDYLQLMSGGKGRYENRTRRSRRSPAD